MSCLVVDEDGGRASGLANLLARVATPIVKTTWVADVEDALAGLESGRHDVCLVRDGDPGATVLARLPAAPDTGYIAPVILLCAEGAAIPNGVFDSIPAGELTAPLLARTIRYAVAHARTMQVHAERQQKLTRLSAELRQQSELLQLAMDNTKHGIAMFDRHGRMTICNARYLSIYGFAPDIVKPGVSIERILRYSISLGNYSDDEASRILSERVLQIASRRPSTYEQRLQDGRTVAVNHQPMADGSSVTTCEDMTERVQKARDSAELARTAALADAANSAKSAFLANMSHELKTPLNAIIGFSQVMQNELAGPLENPTYKTYVSDILDSGSALLRIVDQMLEAATLLDDGEIIDEGTFDLAELLAELVEGIEVEAAEKRLTVRLAGVSTAVFFHGDRERLARALECILHNAVKYTLPRGMVVVSLRRPQDGGLTISISDTGIGIPADKLSGILSPFGQAESGYERVHHGAGLGLSIADGLVRLHGGGLTVDSSEGLGTTVAVALPAERLRASDGHGQAAPPRRKNLAG